MKIELGLQFLLKNILFFAILMADQPLIGAIFTKGENRSKILKEVVDYVDVPTNRTVIGVELGGTSDSDGWLSVKRESPLRCIFKELIYDKTPVSKRIVGARYFGRRDRKCKEEELAADFAAALTILERDFGLKLKACGERTARVSLRGDLGVAVVLDYRCDCLRLEIQDYAWRRVNAAEWWLARVYDGAPADYCEQGTPLPSILWQTRRPGHFKEWSLLSSERALQTNDNVRFYRRELKSYLGLLQKANEVHRKICANQVDAVHEIDGLVSRFNEFAELATKSCVRELSPRFEPEPDPSLADDVALGNALGFSVPKLSKRDKLSYTNEFGFSRIDLCYLGHRLSSVTAVREYGTNVTLEAICREAESCKETVEKTLGVKFADSQAKSELHSYKTREKSYSSLTAARRFKLSYSIKKPFNQEGRELVVRVLDRRITKDYRHSRVESPGLVRLKVGPFLVGEHYDGSLKDLLRYGTGNAFSVTNAAPWLELPDCRAYVDKVSTNVYEVEYSHSCADYDDKSKLKQALDDLCERVERSCGIQIPEPEEDSRYSGFSACYLERGDFVFWLEAGRCPPVSGREYHATVSVRVRHVDAYDNWYETRRLDVESAWEGIVPKNERKHRRPLEEPRCQHLRARDAEFSPSAMKALEDYRAWEKTHPYCKAMHKIDLMKICGRSFGEPSEFLKTNVVTTGGSSADLLKPFPPFIKMHRLYGAQPDHPMVACHFGRYPIVAPESLTVKGDYEGEAKILKERFEEMFGIKMERINRTGVEGYGYRDDYDEVEIRLNSRSTQGTHTNHYPLVVDIRDLELNRRSDYVMGAMRRADHELERKNLPKDRLVSVDGIGCKVYETDDKSKVKGIFQGRDSFYYGELTSNMVKRARAELGDVDNVDFVGIAFGGGRFCGAQCRANEAVSATARGGKRFRMLSTWTNDVVFGVFKKGQYKSSVKTGRLFEIEFSKTYDDAQSLITKGLKDVGAIMNRLSSDYGDRIVFYQLSEDARKKMNDQCSNCKESFSGGCKVMLSDRIEMVMMLAAQVYDHGGHHNFLSVRFRDVLLSKFAQIEGFECVSINAGQQESERQRRLKWIRDRFDSDGQPRHRFVK